MKTIKSIILSLSFLLVFPLSSMAQEENESFLLNVTEFTVKFGHDSNFTDGVKKWNKCYKDNNGSESWRVWHRLQGKGNVYVLASSMANWAEMDEGDEAGKACQAIAINSIIPHIESTRYDVARSMPSVSKNAPLGDNTIVWVTSFLVNDYMSFNEIVKDVTKTISDKEGSPRAYWYQTMGGETSDYFVSMPFKDFADLDNDMDNVWKVYSDVHGESKMKEIRKKFNESLDHAWSYIYTLDKDLSMNQN
ncbi:MAG: hypothetical protein HRU26_03365 [Psychroserpens sp.]|nr:hypothetical protein [Psychroserpens sp.]